MVDPGGKANEEKLEEITAVLDLVLSENGDHTLMTGLDILVKLLTNIIKNPKDEKFRMIKRTNPAINKKLLTVTLIDQLILALGYVELNMEFYKYESENIPLLVQARNAIEERLNKIKEKYMTPEDKKKAELIAHQQKLAKEAQRKKREEMDRMQKLSMHDRKEKGEEEVKASHANELNFGANVCVFKPPEPAPKGAVRRGG